MKVTYGKLTAYAEISDDILLQTQRNGVSCFGTRRGYLNQKRKQGLGVNNFYRRSGIPHQTLPRFIILKSVQTAEDKTV